MEIALAFLLSEVFALLCGRRRRVNFPAQSVERDAGISAASAIILAIF